MPPATTTAGATIAPAVQVEVRDATGRTATAFNGDVTVAIATNPGGGTLSGSTTVAAVAGVATFATLSIDKSGTGYTLTASAAGLPDASSAAFAITAGAPAQLAFVVQPKATAAGTPIAPAVQVAAQDALGNTVPGFTGSVTLAITAGTGTGGATLSGATSGNAVAGVATFSTLSIDLIGTDASGTGYTLSATATGLAAATSDVFDITAGSASRLVFTVQPSPTGAGAHIAPPVQVTARDASGNTVSEFTGNVTVALGTNPGGTLSGTTTVAAVKGVATFSTLSVDHVGSVYTLLATGTGLTTGASSAFAITPGAATRLGFTLQPGTTTAGAAITPAVQIAARDALDNAATGFSGNVTVAIASGPGTLAGTRTVAAIAGVATFPGLGIDQVGSHRLSATAAGLAPDTSAAFDIIASTPTQLAFTIQPPTATAGATITPAVQVVARDFSGQTATSFAGDVTLAIAAGTGPTGAALLGTTTVAAVNGVATFSDLHIDRSGSGYELTATAAGLTTANSASFNVSAGAATHLVFSVQPSTAMARATITPQVEVTARDALGNTAEGFTSNVTVAITTGTGSGGATLAGTTTLAAVAGVAAFATLSIDQAGSGYTLTATGGGLPPVTSALFDITAGAGNHLVFTVQPSTTPTGAQITPAVLVAAKDALGNTVTAFTGDVTVTITGGTGAGGATLSGGTTVAAVAGVATFSTLSIDKSATGYMLSATATGLSGATSVAFAITSGAVARLVFTVQPVSTTAGASITPAVQVTARDAQNNSVDTYTGTVSVAIAANPAGGTLSGTKAVAAVGGVATFAGLSIDKAGSGYTISATATGVTGVTSAAFTISPGPATQLGFTVQPSTTTAGTGIMPAIEVTARDSRGNTVPSFTENVTVAIGTNPGGGGTLSGTRIVAAASGVARFSGLSIDKSGTGYTLTATGGGLAAATSASFDVVAGPATQLAFTVPPITTTAGATIRPAVRVTALDALGNTAPGFAGNVTVAIGSGPPGGTLSGTRTFAGVAGVATFPGLSIDSVGIGYTLTASALGLTGAISPAFDIIPSTPSRLFFTVEPTDTANSVTAGIVITPAVQVSVRDVSGQMVTSFTGNVTLTIAAGTGTSGATLLGTTTVPAVGGVASFSDLNINLAGTGYKLTAAAGGLPAVASAFFNVTAGTATQLVFTVQPSTATAKATIAPQVEVTARDALGNTADGFTGQVTVAIAGGPGGAALSGKTTATAVAGAAAFSSLSIDKSGTGYTLAASAPGLTAATSAPFDITAARATELVFTVQPTSRTAGATISPAVQVTARNAAGLTATGFTGTVTVAIVAGTGTSDATLSGTRTVAAVAGVATFPSLSIDRSGSGYKLSATATGLAGGTSNAFTINPGTPSVLAFTQQPDETVAGATITPPVQVTVRDALGNPVKMFTGAVTMAIEAGANPGNGTLSGTTTVAAVAGVASFNDLSIDRTGVGYRLQAGAGGVSSATSNAFVIAPGPATVLVFSVQPSSATAGATIKPNVRVAAFDALGNAATGFTDNVTVTITPGTGTSGATLSGTTMLAAVNGIAQFSDLKIDLRGSGYRLSAMAGGTAGVTSTTFDILAQP